MKFEIRYIVLFHVLLCSVRGAIKQGKRGTWSQTYLPITSGISGCFRLLNATHQIGCQSKEQGNSGVVQVVESSEDIQIVVENRFSHGPYVVVFELADGYFSLQNLKRLEKSGNVAGIILVHNETKKLPPRYSDDYECPNSLLSLYSPDRDACQWNKNATGLWFNDFEFPIFFIAGDENLILLIEKCYNHFNRPFSSTKGRSWPLCATQMSFRMSAAINAPTCIRRSSSVSQYFGSSQGRQCDPINGNSVFAIVPTPVKDVVFENGSVMVVAVRMDSFSMFDQLSPGADATISGQIVLLAAVEAIGSKLLNLTRPVSNKQKHVLFAVFNGEALDYIGSTSFLYNAGKSNSDLQFTLLPQHIGSYLEVNQVGKPKNNTFWIHSDRRAAEVTDLVKQLKASVPPELKLKMPLPLRNLPPSSAQIFLKATSRSIPAIVITDHEKEYNNWYYHSFLDKTEFLTENVAELWQSLASGIATVAYLWLTNVHTSVTADLNYVKQLSDCHGINNSSRHNCSLFSEILGIPSNSSKFPHADLDNTYCGPAGQKARERILRQLVAYTLATKIEPANESTECSTDMFPQSNGTIGAVIKTKNLLHRQTLSSEWVCVLSSANFAAARSPAFDIEGYDFSSGQYSTWVEPVWPGLSQMLFLKPSPSWQYGVFVVGLIVLCLSSLLAFFVDRKSDVLFATNVVNL